MKRNVLIVAGISICGIGVLCCLMPKHVTGDAFVVLADRETVKLSLLEIDLIKLEEANSRMAEKRKQAESELPRITAQLSEAALKVEKLHKDGEELKALNSQAREQFDKQLAQAENETGSEEYQKRLRDSSLSLAKMDINILSDVEALSAKNETEAKVKSQLRENLARELKFWTGSEVFFSEPWKTKTKTVVTDSDGRFNISVPIGRYAIAAHTVRQTLNGTEHYGWLVPVDGKNISLNNQNMIVPLTK